MGFKTIGMIKNHTEKADLRGQLLLEKNTESRACSGFLGPNLLRVFTSGLDDRKEGVVFKFVVGRKKRLA